jgi:hypothetical protein
VTDIVSGVDISTTGMRLTKTLKRGLSHTMVKFQEPKASLVDNVFTLRGGEGVILDNDGRLVAYNKNGVPADGQWDWVRIDCRKN